MSTPDADRLRDGAGLGRTLDLWNDVQHLPRDEQIDRLAGDAVVVAELREAGWQGEGWDFVAMILAEYGLAVIGGWLRTGAVVAKCQEKRIRATPLPTWVQHDPDEQQDLAAMIVTKALYQFQHAILPKGVWDPKRGAALSTYFIGQCLIQYPNVAAQWIHSRQLGDADVSPMPMDELDAFLPPIAASEREDQFLADAIVAELLSTARTDRGRRALEMKYFGYSHQEIANELGCTASAVAQLLDREKRYLRERMRTQMVDGRWPA